MQTLEVMVALSILAITLLGLTGLLVGSISAGAVAETSSIASNLARQQLDTLCGQAVINPGTTTTTIQIPPPGARTYTIVTTVGAPVGNLMSVDVVVSWQVAFASACAGTGCAGNVRTYSRRIRTMLSAVNPC